MAKSKPKSKLESKALSLIDQVVQLLPKNNLIDWRRTYAVAWKQDFGRGRFEPINTPTAIRLSDLKEIDRQKELLVNNTLRFCKDLPANNALLWGARGTGKSSLVHALLNEYADIGLRLIEIQKEHLADISSVADLIQSIPYYFILVCDDLSFDAQDDGYKKLKSALEGSVFAGIPNLLIYATSNRRHLVAEHMQDNLDSRHVGGELHESEAIEEKISLSDRFGLWLSFYAFGQDEYFNVVRYWINKIAENHGITIYLTEALQKEANAWALQRGGRSGRTANHFARHIVGTKLLEESE